MKKVISVILCIVICFSALCVSAASVPDFMKNIYTNYTADYKVSMSIENAEEIVELLDELEMPEEVNNYIDIKALIESLCRVNSVMNVSLEASEDFRQIKAEITSNTNQNIVLNRNFDASYNAKTGIWIDMDIDSRKLVLVYSTPLNEKYAVIDFAKDAPKEVSDALFDAYDEIINREFIEKNNKDIIDIVTKHVDISMRGNTCTVKYDNDAFAKVLDDVVDYLANAYSDEKTKAFFSEIPSFEGIRFLGNEGVTCTYKLSGKKIKSFTESWDISLSLSDVYTKTTQEAWPYESKGNIDLSIKIESDVEKIGKTRVSLPELTEENSFSLTQMYAANDEYEDTFDGERYYMPLRLCIEEAYVGCSHITYDKGVVTINTDCGEAQKDISATLKVGDDTAVVNGVTYDGFGAFKMIDGSVYASVDFFEECLGWELCCLQKDLLEGSLWYEFYTSSLEEY